MKALSAAAVAVVDIPFKLHAVAPGGPPEGHHGRERGEGEEKLKLHAVAPGGPPEGQCKEGQEMVCSTTFDDPFRTTAGDRNDRPLRRLNKLRGGRSYLSLAVVWLPLASSQPTHRNASTSSGSQRCAKPNTPVTAIKLVRSNPTSEKCRYVYQTSAISRSTIMSSSNSDEDIILEDPPAEINPYEVLGVETTATERDIKTAYRRAALKHHPGLLLRSHRKPYLMMPFPLSSSTNIHYPPQTKVAPTPPSKK